MIKKTLVDVEVKGLKVLVRVDFNVAMEGNLVVDDSRITASLPTIQYLVDQGARVILCSHLGRPDGRVVPNLSLHPVADHLSRLLGRNVFFVEDCIGPEVVAIVKQLCPGDVMLLENLRFYPEEEMNDASFAASLASVADLFVNDGFGVAHRAHSSTEGVTHYLPSVAGFLMGRELDILGSLLDSPKKPLVLVMGGAKISDKIGVLENLLDKIDTILIGGGMAATFLKAHGVYVGNSIIEEELVGYSKRITSLAKSKGISLLLPLDVVVSKTFGEDGTSTGVDVNEIPEDWLIMDIGHRTLDTYRKEVVGASTVLWNGPMGVFEFSSFARGTKELGSTLASLDECITVVGGGSTAEAVNMLGISDKMTHVSTGGGASLEFLEGRSLPGVVALQDK